jgi:hypothetical protein
LVGTKCLQPVEPRVVAVFVFLNCKSSLPIMKRKNVKNNVTEGVILVADTALGIFTSISGIKSVKDLYGKIQGELLEEKIESFMKGSKGYTKEQQHNFLQAITTITILKCSYSREAYGPARDLVYTTVSQNAPSCLVDTSLALRR